MIDLQLIDKGQPYRERKRSFVIFICLSDVFGYGRHIYTFENICVEDTNIRLADEATKIFLNANGQANDVSNELKAVLDYIGGKPSEDDFVKKLDEAVREAKKNREWRHEYMTLWMRDQENIEKGIQQGIQQGDAIRLMESVDSIVHNLKLSVEDACKALNVTLDAYFNAKAIVKKQ